MLAAASGATGDVDVQRVRRVQDVAARVRISNDFSQDVVVPYCGDLYGQRYLCELAVRLEVFSGGAWVDAVPKCRCSVPGGVELDRSLRIAPGRAENFEFRFPSDSFAIRRGQKLRFRVQVWSSEKAMKDREAGQVLYSTAFRLP